MIRVFTGPSHLTTDQLAFVNSAVHALGITADDEIRTGAAEGVDSEACVVAMVRQPRARHRIFFPAARYNKGMDALLYLPNVQGIRCPPGAEPYRIRNTVMLTGEEKGAWIVRDHGWSPTGQADVLHAFVREPTFYRSGEWMTINIARRLGVRVDLRELP